MSKKRAKAHPQTAHVWASLTVSSFIIVYLCSIIAGANGLLPFVYGAVALFATLLVEAIVRGHLWPFDEAYRSTFSDMDGVARRLMLLSGTLLLILESTILVMMWV